MDRESIRRQLYGKRAELLANMHGIRADVMRSKGKVADDDLGPVEHEEFIFMCRNSLNRETLQLVEAAIERLDLEEYGTCHGCEEPISPKRLAALPWAKYCVSCQERASLLDLDMPATGAAGLEPVELYS